MNVDGDKFGSLSRRKRERSPEESSESSATQSPVVERSLRGEKLDFIIFFYETEFVLFSVVLENSVLPMGWDSSHATLKVTSEL